MVHRKDNLKKDGTALLAFPFFGHRQVAMYIEKRETVHAPCGTWTFVACPHIRSFGGFEEREQGLKVQVISKKFVKSRNVGLINL